METLSMLLIANCLLLIVVFVFLLFFPKDEPRSHPYNNPSDDIKKIKEQIF